MDERDPSGRDLDAEIAARDHHRVRRAHDAREVVERDRRLDLRDQLRTESALGQSGAHRFDVFGPAYEREPDEVGLDRDRHLERSRVRVREGLDMRLGPGHVHALARAQAAAAYDLAQHVAVDDAGDAQHDRAVGKVDLVAGGDPSSELRERGRDAVHVADDGRGREHDLAAGFELDLVVGHRARAHLRAGKVDEHADRATEGRRRLPREPRVLRVDGGIAVRGVEAYDVGARGEQCTHRFRLRRGGADGRDDLRAPHTPGL